MENKVLEKATERAKSLYDELRNEVGTKEVGYKTSKAKGEKYQDLPKAPYSALILVTDGKEGMGWLLGEEEQLAKGASKALMASKPAMLLIDSLRKALEEDLSDFESEEREERKRSLLELRTSLCFISLLFILTVLQALLAMFYHHSPAWVTFIFGAMATILGVYGMNLYKELKRT